MCAAAALDLSHWSEEQRILGVLPTLRDAAITTSMLRGAHLECVCCPNLHTLVLQMQDGVGALLLTEEALNAPGIQELLAVLARQPSWSDIPIVMQLRDTRSPTGEHVLHELRNVTLIERPAPMRSVLSALQAALRARSRQYEMRAQLQQIALTQQALIASDQALREANRRKDTFLATLAHELRNPLAPIRHAATLLGAVNTTEQQRGWGREVIARQAQHMAWLLDDLLDISRITNGRLVLRKEMVSLQSVVAAAVETARPLIDQRRHTLTVQLPSEPLELLVDKLRLSQVLSNLLTNAAKYTNPGGRVALQAEIQQEELVLHVTDNGIGLEPEATLHIFDMFSQVNPTADRSQGGLGIGLALVRGLIELHGGSVGVESEGAGRGARFFIRLPLRSETVAVAGRAAVSDPPFEQLIPTQARTILIADDNGDAADSLALMLRLGGHAVHVVSSGLQAIEQFGALSPDIVLLDIGMPGIDGYEVARRLRRERDGAVPLLVAVTGWGQDTDKVRAREAGFDHHFTKPVDFTQLASLIAAVPGPSTHH